jgi:predicted Ser/Thr protein kinase
MATSLMCPDETELLALAAGEEPSEELRAHLSGCPACRGRLEQLKVELATLREGAPESPLSTATASGPVADPTTSHCQAGQPDATATKLSSNSAETRSSDAATDPGFSCDAGDNQQANVPAVIGRYLVISRFPRTGQADVFRVVHPGLRKDLVLKLALEPVRPDGRCEIIEEGKILAELEHPNLVQVFDSDFHEDRPYLVMAYVRGRTLEQLASEGRLKPRRAAALLAKVATAADYAHRRGITHRDIKPKNILVDESGEPKLIDFGMARLRHAYTDEPAQPGGTFSFMSPEQAHVESPQEQEKVGPRSDVFALGAVLYFLLTGEAPFTGRTWQKSMDRARRCDFDRRALDGRQIPRDLRHICLKAMAADPADRYNTAEEYQKALKRYVAKPRVQAALAGVFGLALLAGAFFVLMKRAETRAERLGVSSPSTAGPIQSSIPAQPVPIKGRINLMVVKSSDGTRRRLRLQEPGAVPVRARDEVRIEARLDRPVYLYLFWISSDGKMAPLYPWKDHDWSQRPLDERKVKDAELPEIFDEVLDIPVSPPGMETLVLLAREQTPLPRGDEDKLAQVLVGASISSPLDLDKPIWIEDGEEVAFEPSVASGKVRSGDDALTRGIPSPKSRKSDDPVLRMRQLLNEKVKPLGSYSQAVLFPNQGGS